MENARSAMWLLMDCERKALQYGLENASKLHALKLNDATGPIFDEVEKAATDALFELTAYNIARESLQEVLLSRGWISSAEAAEITEHAEKIAPYL